MNILLETVNSNNIYLILYHVCVETLITGKMIPSETNNPPADPVIVRKRRYLIQCARFVSRITFIRYAQSQIFGRPNMLKVFERKIIKGSKQKVK